MTEPFIGSTGKCHQQRLSSDKKTATSLSQQHHQPPLPSLVTTPEDNPQQQQQVTVAMRPVGCAELEDLIHLAGPLTEDAVLKCLQARFCASQFFVSIHSKFSQSLQYLCMKTFHYVPTLLVQSIVCCMFPKVYVSLII